MAHSPDSSVIGLSRSPGDRVVRRSVLINILIASAVLASGTWVYIAERAPDATAVFSTINLSHRLPSILGAVAGSLPTFAHTFSFSIFTALILGPTRRAVFRACLSWLLIGVAFEVGQHPAVSPNITSYMGFSEALRAYLEAGTFDVLDLFSILLGATIAFLILNRTLPR